MDLSNLSLGDLAPIFVEREALLVEAKRTYDSARASFNEVKVAVKWAVGDRPRPRSASGGSPTEVHTLLRDAGAEGLRPRDVAKALKCDNQRARLMLLGLKRRKIATNPLRGRWVLSEYEEQVKSESGPLDG